VLRAHHLEKIEEQGRNDEAVNSFRLGLGLVQFPILSQILLCKKKILYHNKMSANA
jgi:hypothetical protein